MGEFRLGELPMCIINGGFGHFQLPVDIRFSDGQFDLVDQALHESRKGAMRAVPAGSPGIPPTGVIISKKG